MSAPVLLACVPEEQVGSAHLLAAWVCQLVCADLDLGEVAIRWLSPTQEADIAPAADICLYRADDFRGLVSAAYPGTIFLRLGQLLPQIFETTAHECRHLYQAAQYGDWAAWWLTQGTEDHRVEQESDATAYAERFAQKLGWWGSEEQGWRLGGDHVRVYSPPQ